MSFTNNATITTLREEYWSSADLLLNASLAMPKELMRGGKILLPLLTISLSLR